ncbi:MAG: MBL fold metallo-hydrolase [Cytophagales bacterium]|nr:MBL fold metallo-hydrolase [Cytophagales bacterium]
MIHIQQFTFNPFMENTLLVYDDTKECVIIDPGCYEKDEQQELASFIENKNLKVKYLLNTHCHIDHVLGNQFVKDRFNVALLLHKDELVILNSNKALAPNYGIPNYQEAYPDEYIDELDKIKFGDTELQVLFVPGHSPGHIAFYNKDRKICISGDVLFQRSIGRTDLPGGDYDTLINSIHKKIFPLGDDMVVYCGHGPSTTVGEEKKYNPFCGIEK